MRLAVLAEVTGVPNTLSDRHIAIGHIYACSAWMRSFATRVARGVVCAITAEAIKTTSGRQICVELRMGVQIHTGRNTFEGGMGRLMIKNRYCEKVGVQQMMRPFVKLLWTLFRLWM